MRVYNATKYQLTVPISRGKYITIKPYSCSTEFIGTSYLVSILVSTKSSDEVAIICAGPSDLALCANVSSAAAYVVQTLDDAIKRFLPEGVRAEKVEEPQKVEPPVVEAKPVVKPVETVKIGQPVKESAPVNSELIEKVSVAKLGEEVSDIIEDVKKSKVEKRVYDSPIIEVKEETVEVIEQKPVEVKKPVVRKKKVVKKEEPKEEVKEIVEVPETPAPKKTTKKTTKKATTKKA